MLKVDRFMMDGTSRAIGKCGWVDGWLRGFLEVQIKGLNIKVRKLITASIMVECELLKEGALAGSRPARNQLASLLQAPSLCISQWAVFSTDFK